MPSNYLASFLQLMVKNNIYIFLAHSDLMNATLVMNCNKFLPLDAHLKRLK